MRMHDVKVAGGEGVYGFEAGGTDEERQVDVGEGGKEGENRGIRGCDG